MAGGGGAVLSPASVASRRAGEPHARRLTAVLQKYHVNEVRSLRFGPTEDASTALLLTLTLVIATHLSLFLYCFAPPHAGAPAGLWDEYVGSKQFVMGALMYFWILGYNLVSLLIYHKFERTETYPADDFYLASSPDHRSCDAGSAASQPAAEPAVLEMPDRQVAIAVPSNEN